MSGFFCTAVKIFVFTASMLHYLHRNNTLTNWKVADLKVPLRYTEAIHLTNRKVELKVSWGPE